MSTNKQPLVSIVVITYNSSKYIVETLESAKAQTHQEIELIVSDDCSTDNTVEICQEWISKNRLRFVRVELLSVLKNTGIPANCNRGAKMARGTWLKFIAGDDVLCSNCIKDNIEFVKSNSLVRIVSSRIIYIDQDSRLIENVYDEYLNLRKHYFALDHKEQLRFYVRIPLFLNSPTFFINRDALIQLNYFDEDLRIYEDISLVY
ncbi:MAG TPA: glycosyltransferase, partial [Williamwhitmania sp.]|nr:glycosyltransferase [Williamwhitmania sp.]